LTPADGSKRAEVIAHQIERDVIARGWPVGEIIGSESDLIEQYSVSRAVLRESVRLLEHHTTARMRRGPGGGLVVTEPKAEAITRPMALYLEYLGVDAAQLFAARKIIELTAVESAAESIDEDGIATLRAALERERTASPDELPQLHRRMHTLLADLSGNPVLSLFVVVLNDLVEERTETMNHIAPQVAAPVHQAHASIVEAVISGDAALARHRMMRHIEAITEWIT